MANSLSGLLTTRDLIESQDKEVIIKTTLRELLIYTIFLGVICTGIQEYSSSSTPSSWGSSVQVQEQVATHILYTVSLSFMHMSMNWIHYPQCSVHFLKIIKFIFIFLVLDYKYCNLQLPLLFVNILFFTSRSIPVGLFQLENLVYFT